MKYFRSDRKVDSIPQPVIEGLDEGTNSHTVILSEVDYQIARHCSSAPLVGDRRTTCTYEIVLCDGEHVVPRSQRRPDLVVLQRIRVDEDTKLRAVPERRHAVIGVGNSMLEGVQAISRTLQEESHAT